MMFPIPFKFIEDSYFGYLTFEVFRSMIRKKCGNEISKRTVKLYRTIQKELLRPPGGNPKVCGICVMILIDNWEE